MPEQIFVGRRKSAVARVRLRKGSGRFELNGRPLEDYFRTEKHRFHVVEPLRLLEEDGKWDVFARLHGGGITGQAGALRLGIARARLDGHRLAQPPEGRRDAVAGCPTRGAQEVRPEEGPQGPPVQQALTARRILVPVSR